MKNSIGIIKEVDRLGRIVIPKEFRERFGLNEKVELVATESGILLRSPEYRLVKSEQK
jgi:AbrB family looped-hinge helix DNA binding protein